ncbi:MAG: N,N-dimethylformamidase beta subunit family domain-containing protein [Nitrososphaera sp.]|jgi:hypothetical protein
MPVLVSSNLAHAQIDPPEIPQWVKNTAKWWSENKTTDKQFLISVAYLIKTNMVNTSNTNSSSDYKIPGWFKKVATFYADNKITEEDFERSIEYLLNTNSITVSDSLLDAIDKRGLTTINYHGFSPLFQIYAYAKDFRIINGTHVPMEAHFALKPDLITNGTYDKIALWDKPHSAAVIVPLFTSTAYWEPGFYTYYRGDCDSSCLTKKILFDRPGGFSASQNAVGTLQLLGYDTITDLDVDQNPQILNQYEKIVVLHNEYVTQQEFDAITHHPKVIYLYANPLYAKVSVDYSNDTITLVKGHGYPTPQDRNAFGWKFDNSEKEYDTNCAHTSFHPTDNGIMLDCYPENMIFTNMTILKIMKDY